MRPARLRPHGRWIVATALLATVLGACAGRGDTADLGGLLALSGDPGQATLRTWSPGAAADGAATIKTPKGTAWVAAGRSDVLVASLLSGDLRTSDPIRPGDDPTWRKVTAKLAGGDAASGPFYFPTWDPEGGRFAALAGDLDAAPKLTLVDPSTSSAFEIDLGRSVVAAPPAWVGPDLVAIPVGDATAPGSILVDTTTGEVRDGPAGGRLFATSADGATIAIVGGDGDTVTIRSTEGWLADDGSSIGSVDAPPGAVAPTALALDADASRLAIAWLDDGGAITVAVHDRSAAWRRVAKVDEGKVAGAVVAWLR